MTGDQVTRLLGVVIGWAIPFLIVFALGALFGFGVALAVTMAFVLGLKLGMWAKERTLR